MLGVFVLQSMRLLDENLDIYGKTLYDRFVSTWQFGSYHHILSLRFLQCFHALNGVVGLLSALVGVLRGTDGIELDLASCCARCIPLEPPLLKKGPPMFYEEKKKKIAGTTKTKRDRLRERAREAAGHSCEKRSCSG